MQATLEKFAKAALRHPFGAIHMRLVNSRSALGLGFRRNAKERFDDFRPISAFGFGVEQAQIEAHVRLIVCCQGGTAGRIVQEVVRRHRIPIRAVVSIVEGFVNDDLTEQETQARRTGSRRCCGVYRKSVLRVRIDKQHSHTLVGVQENDAVAFEGAPDLIARAFVNLEAALGFEALERGQGYSGLVRERLLCPTQQRACGP